MVKKILSTFVFTVSFFTGFTQYTQVGTGFFGSANFGPLRTDTTSSYYSKFAFTYPEASLDSLQHGDTLRSLSFFYNAFDSIRGSATIRILIGATDNADFGATPLNWDSASRVAMVEVYNGNPKTVIGNQPREVFFPFAQPYLWDTVGGNVHLKVFVEYIQSTNQTGIFQWNVENGTSVPGFVSADESKFLFNRSNNGIDSITNRNSLIKPTLKLYHPRHKKDLEVNKIYSLGTIPVLMRRADTIKALVTNVGMDTIQSQKVYLYVRGANSFSDSVVVNQLPPYTQVMVKFSSYVVQNLGTETLTVQVEPDDNPNNDSLVKMRAVNYNVYSHNDPFMGSSGGIGFNGGTGDFVAKFYVDGISYINQIAVDFNRANQPFQLVVWDDDGTNGLPGTELFVSDTSQSVTGTFIMPVLPRIAVSNGYFVGIRQTSTTNVSFTFQEENPIRPHTFYFAAPARDTIWTNFDPGFNFNFNIRPRLQVANDVAVLDFVTPLAGDSLLYSGTDSIDLIARIINFGYQNQGSFIVRGQLFNQFNILEENRTVIISLPAEDTAVVNFGKISKFRLGNYRFRVTTEAPLDSVIDNNQATIEFTFFKEYDVAVDQVFSPQANDKFTMQRDPLQVVVRLANYGIIAHTDLPVILQLLGAKNEVLYTQSKLVDLGALSSRILAFDTTYLASNEVFVLRVFTDLASDSFRINDTVYVHPIVGEKRDDVLISDVARPAQGQQFAKNASMRPFVSFRNDGLNSQDSVVVEALVYNVRGDTLYYDSIHRSLSFFSLRQALFKPMLLDSIGSYTFIARVTIDDDQVPVNDTMSTHFNVVTGNDLRLVAVVNPVGILPVNSPNENVRVVVLNAGINDIDNAPVTVSIENNTGADIYTDQVSVSLMGGAIDTLIFKELTFNTLGNFYLTATNIWSGEDERQSSDTLRSSYITRFALDLGVVDHLLPEDTIEINEVIRPRFTLLNSGIDTIKNIRVAVHILDHAGVLLFADTVMPPDMAANIQYNLNTNTTWASEDGGVFTLRSVVLNTDDNPANNAFASTFVVAKRYDMEVLRADGPTTDENILKGSLYKPVATFGNAGLNAINNADVICEIKIGANTIYERTKTINIPIGQSVEVSFDSTLYYAAPAQAIAMFRVAFAADQVAHNDTVVSVFNFVQGANIAELDANRVEVFPNPVSHSFVLRSDAKIQKVMVFNDLGVVVSKIDGVLSNLLEVSLEEMATGTYFVHIATTDGNLTKQVVKR